MTTLATASDRPRRQSILIGPAAVIAIVAVYVAIWLIARPADQPTVRYAGEMIGMLALLLLSLALVTASGLMRILEPAFGGFDRVLVWHRRIALTGVLVLLLHPVLAGATAEPSLSSIGNLLGLIALLGFLFLTLWALAPRIRHGKTLKLITRMASSTYEKWRIGHRFMGLFVAAATVHAALVDPVLQASPLLMAITLLAGGVGVAAYLYREFLAERLTPVYQYTVQEATQLNVRTIEVGLEPIGKPMELVEGQFIFLALGVPEGYEYHPFTVASAPTEKELRLTIGAAGDYTRGLYEDLRPGIQARVVGPFGMFDYRRGEARQVWVAAGIGITPFLSWIRALHGSFGFDVDFFYTVANEAGALYVEEIKAATVKYPSFRLHLSESDRDGRLTPEQLWADHPLAGTSVYMCGPSQMMRAFEAKLRAHGVAEDHIRWEQFGLR